MFVYPFLVMFGFDSLPFSGPCLLLLRLWAWQRLLAKSWPCNFTALLPNISIKKSERLWAKSNSSFLLLLAGTIARFRKLSCKIPLFAHGCPDNHSKLSLKLEMLCHRTSASLSRMTRSASSLLSFCLGRPLAPQTHHWGWSGGASSYPLHHAC